MEQVKWLVPTYHAGVRPEAVENGGCAEYGPPRVGVVVREAEGVRVLLGTHDPEDRAAPDVLIERQPSGWVLFIHPIGGSDPSGCVYMHDDGRSFALPERGIGPTPALATLESGETVPGFAPENVERPERPRSGGKVCRLYTVSIEAPAFVRLTVEASSAAEARAVAKDRFQKMSIHAMRDVEFIRDAGEPVRVRDRAGQTVWEEGDEESAEYAR